MGLEYLNNPPKEFSLPSVCVKSLLFPLSFLSVSSSKISIFNYLAEPNEK